MSGTHWVVLFALILAAWAVLFVMALPGEGAHGHVETCYSIFFPGHCAVTPDFSGYIRVTLMWVVMSAAMMAPTALPAFATFDDLNRAGRAGFAGIAGGFLLVWVGFSVFAGAAQVALIAGNWLSPLGESRSGVMSGLLLLVAGLYQFSPLKEGCLSKCRQPIAFFMQYWKPGAAGAWQMGARLGLVCLGCCWALMLLAFVGGVMNLGFMGLATLIMVLEKLPDIGRVLTKPLGVVLIVASGIVLLGAVQMA